MALIFRTSSLANTGPSSIKNAPLTYEEGDGNFAYLLTNMSGSVITLEGGVDVTGSLEVRGPVTTFDGVGFWDPITLQFNTITAYGGNLILTGSLYGTSSWAVSASQATSALTASFVTASNVYGPFGSNSVLSSSFAVSASWAPITIDTSSFITTGSSTAVQRITGSLIMSRSLVVSGTLDVGPSSAGTSFLGTSYAAFYEPYNGFYGTEPLKPINPDTTQSAAPAWWSSPNGSGISTSGGVRYYMSNQNFGHRVLNPNNFTNWAGAIKLVRNNFEQNIPNGIFPYHTVITNNATTQDTLVDIFTTQANNRYHVLTVTGSFLARDGVSLGTSISNTHFITGSVRTTGSLFLRGLASTSQANVLTYNSSTGQVFFTASNAIGGGGGGGTPGGADTEIQFNQGGAFGADSTFKFVYASQSLEQGLGVQGIGQYSHAEGDTTQAIGPGSHAEGSLTQAIGEASHAEGANTIASGSYSHAEGADTQAIGGFSHVEGIGGLAIGFGSHAEGGGTTAIGITSHAEGQGTQAIGFSSHAEGLNTQASGSNSHAEGSSTIASGSYSHAEGNNTRAIGEGSHAEGNNTRAIGDHSHAEGDSTRTIGSYSHAEGVNTVALGNFQSVIGQFNISSSAQSAFIIGNGADDNNRSNLLFAQGTQFQISGSLFISGAAESAGNNNVLTYNTTTGLVTYTSSAAIGGGGSPIDTSAFLTTGSLSTTQQLSGSLNVTGSLNFFSGSTNAAKIENGWVVLSQVSMSLDFANDAAAAAGGVPLGGLYRNGNAISIRIV